MLIAQLLQQGKAALIKGGVPQAEIDVQLLLGHCLKKSRTQLYICSEDSATQAVCIKFWSYIERRVKREPVAYILGQREFWSLPFYVNKDVLIPRPETEFLLETVLRSVKKSGMVIDNAIDLCCGSGVIGVVLALEINSRILALDITEKALAVTKTNSQNHEVQDMVKPILSDLFSGLGPSVFPLIVSNPPYVRYDEISNSLEPEVADFEPHLALDGGSDGLEIIRRISDDILNFLAPEGMFFMEFGAEQAGDIKEIFSLIRVGVRHFQTIEIYQDYSGRDRVLFAKANNYGE